MKTILRLGLCGLLVLAATATTALGAARSNRVSIAYVPPKNPAHQQIYQRLKQSRVLERLQVLLSPFRLPRTLKVSLAGCDGEADAFYEDAAITICYEYIADLRIRMPAKTTPAGIEPIDTIVGPLIDTSLHEAGHALFDMLQLPVFGREEDAADQVAAYIYLHFGKTIAPRLIMGTAYAYLSEAKENAASPPSLTAFSGEHGTPAQRMFNVLCMAYGSDPKLFGYVVTKGYLPEKRAEQCGDEYDQVANAFEDLVHPHLDLALVKQLQGRLAAATPLANITAGAPSSITPGAPTSRPMVKRRHGAAPFRGRTARVRRSIRRSEASVRPHRRCCARLSPGPLCEKATSLREILEGSAVGPY